MPFDQSTRNRLSRFVSDARSLLSDEFTRQLQHEYGMDPAQGLVAPLTGLPQLDDARRETARILRGTFAHYMASAPKDTKPARRQALQRIVREQAFTVLNRLGALRMAEARGLLVESLSRGPSSQGFQLYAHLAGSALGETGQAYVAYLFSLFDELAVDLPVLFDRYSPEGRLFPRETVLWELLEEINHPDLTGLWAEDETIGWIYQYFNSQEERRQMRAASSAPRNSRELAVRNQFFTPRYVVEFLTDNTLGRIWYEMTQGETTLAESCRYLVRRPHEVFLQPGQAPPETDVDEAELSQEELLQQPAYIPHRPLKDPRAITMLDPACGSIHFGLYAFDLFERIYAEAWALEGERGPDAWQRPGGMGPLRQSYADEAAFRRDVPRLILANNIHGIDIDPRAVQIAGLSLWLRAQRSWQAQGLAPAQRPAIRRSNVVCAEPMPGEADLLDEFVATLDPPLIGDLVRLIFQEMKLAGEAGSLLKIEETLQTQLDQARAQWERDRARARGKDGAPMLLTQQQVDALTTGPIQGRFDLTGIDNERFWRRAEARVLVALRDYAEQAENGAGYRRRLFAADAAQGFAFIDLCRQRYDVVLMNPPFGRRSEPGSLYYDRQYGSFKSDIGLAFVDRFSLLLTDRGQLGAITSRTFLAGGSFETWRRDVLLSSRPVRVMVDLGIGVLDDAMVETCAYIVHRQSTTVGWFLRALEAVDKRYSIESYFDRTQSAQNALAFVTSLGSMKSLPMATMAYWLPSDVALKIKAVGTLDSIQAATKHGVQTTDDFQFMRLVWETPIGTLSSQSRWPVLAKGGEYAPYFDNLHLCVDWFGGGKKLKAYLADKRLKTQGSADWTPWMNSHEYYFEPGLTFPARTASDFCPRVLPAGCVFTASGQAVLFPTTQQAMGYLSGAFTRAFKIIVDALVCSGDNSVSGSAANTYRTGLVNAFSLPGDVNSCLAAQIGDSCVSLARQLAAREEISLDFCPTMTKAASLQDLGTAKLKSEFSVAAQILELNHKADRLAQRFFGFGDDLLLRLHGPLPTDYPAIMRELDSAILISGEDALVREASKRFGPRRQLTKKTYHANRRLELLCHIFQVHPSVIVDAMSRCLESAEVDTETVESELSLLVGYVLGRWDIRYGTGERPVPELPDPFDPLPVCPPGMLQNDQGLPASPTEVPDDYPLRISWPGILVDDPGHREDVVGRVREALRVIWGERADAIEAEACQILGEANLRAYFANPNRFFDDHLKRYSKSRRYAPIYWPLATASGSYTLWCYYHRLDDQTLYTCVNDFVQPKLAAVQANLTRLRGLRQRDNRQERELAALKDLALELADFRDELLRVAAFWRPNLNDGVQITAAPLWRLFPHRRWGKRLHKTWDELSSGEYDWAHLALSIWPERVVPACVEDRSFAIAHELEDLLWVEDGDDDWRPLMEPGQEAAQQIEGRQSLARDHLRDLLAELAVGRDRALPADQVAQHLADGDWDDMTVAARLWPERVAERCWEDRALAEALSVRLTKRRSKAAHGRAVKQLTEAGCPDLAEAVLAALTGVDAAYETVWAELDAGARDDEPLALALWPGRVVGKCLTDPALAECHGLRRFFWYKEADGRWRRRQRPAREVQNEIARRRGNKGA